MASELVHTHTTSGLATVYAQLYSGASIVNASTGALLTRNSSNWATGAIAGSDSAAAYNYLASVPASTPAGWYTALWFLKAGGSYALGDAPLSDGVTFYWTGTAVGVAIDSLTDAALQSFWTRNAFGAPPINNVAEGSVVDAVYTAVNVDTGAIYTKVTDGSIANSVWDEQMDDHKSVGSMGRSQYLSYVRTPVRN